MNVNLNPPEWVRGWLYIILAVAVAVGILGDFITPDEVDQWAEVLKGTGIIGLLYAVYNTNRNRDVESDHDPGETFR